MAHYGTLPGRLVGAAGEEVRGASVYGTNHDKLGKIVDVILDHSTGSIRYAVVDTGGWLSTKKFLVPTEVLRTSRRHKDDFEAHLTKQQIESLPTFDESDLQSEPNWSRYEWDYRAKWVADAVQHRAETDRNITPTTRQMKGNVRSEQAPAGAHGESVAPTIPSTSTSRAEADREAASRPSERVIPPGTDTVVISSNAEGIGGRRDTFESRLRARRKEAVAAGRTCSGESAVERGSESVENFRKAV